MKAVFVDRDGVLNEAVVREGRPYAPGSLEELRIYPEAAQALARLKAAGYFLIVITNQPDVGRGQVTMETVEAINAKVRAALPVDDIRVCYHDDKDNCACRKPKPGLVLDAARDHGIDLAESYLVGDRWRDIDCGAAAGVRTVLVDRGWKERGPSKPADFVCGGVEEAVEWVLGGGR